MNKFTKKIFLIIFILLFIIIILAFGIYLCKSYLNNNKNKYMINGYVPTSNRNTYILQNVDDSLINNYISKHDNTLIVFWASWCQACVEEANELNNFINNNPNITVIVVSFDKNITDLENYLKNNNYNWFVIFDTERKIRKSLDNDIKGIPATYLINNTLNVISKEITSMDEDGLLKFYNLNK